MLRCQLGFTILKRVLPSRYRTKSPLFPRRWFRRDLAVTRTRRFATKLHSLRLPAGTPPGCCATAHILLRSPTTGAATPPASAPPPQSLASLHSCRHARLASAPIVSDPY